MSDPETRDPEHGSGNDRKERGGRRKRRGEGADTARPRKLRPLHTPSPVAVRTDDRGRPTAVGTGGGAAPGHGAAGGHGTDPETGRTAGRPEVVQIRESWRIDDEWWREPVSRLYFEVVLESGKRTVLYRDLVGGGWYRQRG